MSECYVENGLMFFIGKYDVTVKGFSERQNSNEIVVIPAMVKKKPVRYIGAEAFKGEKLLELFLPQTIERVADSAFCDCKQLTVVTEYQADVPANILIDRFINIGKCAFANCGRLKTITFNRQIANVERSAFASCFSLSDIYAIVKNVHDYAFVYCKDLKILNIGSDGEISKDAFTLWCPKRLVFENSAKINDGILSWLKTQQIAVACPCDSNLVNLAFNGFKIEIV